MTRERHLLGHLIFHTNEEDVAVASKQNNFINSKDTSPKKLIVFLLDIDCHTLFFHNFFFSPFFPACVDKQTSRFKKAS
jgi:hypothetical protein